MKRMGLISILAMAVMFIACKQVVTPIGGSPSSGENSSTTEVQVSNIRSASVGGKESATVILAWQANDSVKLLCYPKAGNLENEVTLDKNQTQFIVTGLEYEKEYTFSWSNEKKVVASLKVKTPEPGKVQLSEEEKESLFQERLLTYLTKEKKVEIFNEILEAKREDETFLSLLTPEEIESLQDHTLTDTEKLAIFEEIYSGIRTSDWIISELTDDEKERIYNDLLSDERKAAIFDEILEAKRNDETFLSLLTDEEKNAIYGGLLTNDEKERIFEEIYAGKRTSAWIISQLTDAEMELIIGSLTAEDLQVLLDEKDTVPPAKVTDFAATIVGDKIRLSWTDSKDDDVLCYEIKFSTAVASRSVSFDSDSIIVPQGKGYAYLNDLIEDTKYTFTICAMDRTGNKSENAQVECTVWKQDVESLMDISNSYYNGVLLYISEEEIPQNADTRIISVDGNVVSKINGNDADADHITDNEWGYPYVKKGSTYNFKIQYLKNETVLKEMETNVKAKSGLGDLKIVKNPEWKYEGKEIVYTSQPEISIDGTIITEKIGYYCVQPYAPSTGDFFKEVIFDSLSIGNINVHELLKENNDNSEIEYALVQTLFVSNSSYGNYCFSLEENSSEKTFKIDWALIPSAIMDISDSETVGVKLKFDFTDFAGQEEIIVIVDGMWILLDPAKTEYNFRYVEPGKEYEISLLNIDPLTGPYIYETKTVTPKTGLLSIEEKGQFSIDNKGVLKIEKEPVLKIGENTINENLMYFAKWSWEEGTSLFDFKSMVSFPGTEYNLAKYIVQNGLESNKGKQLVDLYSVIFMSEDSEYYDIENLCFAKLTDEPYISEIDWTKINSVITDIADDETIGLKLRIDKSFADNGANGYEIYVNDFEMGRFPLEQEIVEIPNVLGGQTYKVKILFVHFSDGFLGSSSFSRATEFTVTAKKGAVTIENTSHSFNKGVIEFSEKPVVKINGKEINSSYRLEALLEYEDSSYYGGYRRNSSISSNGRKVNLFDNIYSNIEDNQYEDFKKKNITNFRYSLNICKEYNVFSPEDIVFIAPLENEVLFTIDWNDFEPPLSLMTGTGINFKLNENFIQDGFNGYRLYINDINVKNEYDSNFLTDFSFPEVVAGKEYNIRLDLEFKDTTKKYFLNVIPDSGDISVSQQPEISMDNGIISLSGPISLKRCGEEIPSEEIKYVAVYKYRENNGSKFSTDSYKYSFVDSKANLFNNCVNWMKDYNEFEYKIFAYSNDYEHQFIVPLMDDYETFYMDWNKEVPSYLDLSADVEAGLKIEISDIDFPSDAASMRLFLDNGLVMEKESSKTVLYPYATEGTHSFSVYYYGRNHEGLNTVYGTVNVEKSGIQIVEKGEYSVNNEILKITKVPVIRLFGEDENVNASDSFDIKVSLVGSSSSTTISAGVDYNLCGLLTDERFFQKNEYNLDILSFYKFEISENEKYKIEIPVCTRKELYIDWNIISPYLYSKYDDVDDNWGIYKYMLYKDGSFVNDFQNVTVSDDGMTLSFSIPEDFDDREFAWVYFNTHSSRGVKVSYTIKYSGAEEETSNEEIKSENFAPIYLRGECAGDYKITINSISDPK